jgi:AGCS family alanine or glycine:cation symporter
MAFPNLIALCALSGVVIAETRTFLDVLKAEKENEDEKIEENGNVGDLLNF